MNIKIHYSFVIYIFILFFLGLLKYFSIFFISILLHEFTHALVGTLYGLKIINIEIDMCGVSIRFDKINEDCLSRIIIYMSRPLINIIIAIITYIIFKERFLFFVLTNLGLFAFNMLPIYPLDGGKIIFEIINKFFYTKKLILKKCYTCFQIIFLFILAMFCINYSNVQLFFLGIYFLRFTIEDKYKNMELF